MAVIDEVIRLESNGTLSFGDYLTKDKKKVQDFDAEGDLYKVKTHDQITRLEKNGSLLLEAVPGVAIHNLSVKENTVTFTIEGYRDTEVTMELLPDKTYNIAIGGEQAGQMESNMSGKINFSVEIDKLPLDVRIEMLV